MVVRSIISNGRSANHRGSVMQFGAACVALCLVTACSGSVTLDAETDTATEPERLEVTDEQPTAELDEQQIRESNRLQDASDQALEDVRDIEARGMP